MKLSLKAKILLAFIVAGLVPLVSIGVYSFQMSTTAVINQINEQLISIRILKKKSVEEYFNLIKSQTLVLAHSDTTSRAFKGFREGFRDYLKENQIKNENVSILRKDLGDFYNNIFESEYKKNNSNKAAESLKRLNNLDDSQIALQSIYIAKNPHPHGKKQLLSESGLKGTYDQAHAKFHQEYLEYLERFEFYDVFIIDGETGNIIYSVFKEIDFATSLKTGPYNKSGLAEAFNKAMSVSDKESVVMVDYQNYFPSYDGPAGFIAAPIWLNGIKVGVVAVQISFDKINFITQEKIGNKETLETYLVGMDYKMRSDSKLDPLNRTVRASFKNPELGSIKTKSVEKTFNGESGISVDNDYLGKESILSYGPLNILDNKWSIVSSIRTEEAFKSLRDLKKAFITLIGASVLLIALFALWFDNKVVSSLISTISRITQSLMGEATSLQKVSETTALISTKLSEVTVQQASSLQETASSVGEISAMVSRNADSAANSAKISEKANNLAFGGKQKVKIMMDSINAISDGNDEIINQMEKSNREISDIVNVIQDISKKTEVINDIVFQTKLLSFNASVEAARAGEQGKGFSVVAEEVGNLATMSGNAANEITSMLDVSIQKVSKIVENSQNLMSSLIKKSRSKIEIGHQTSVDCSVALEEIVKNVSSLNDMVKEISHASQQQSTGIHEINKAMEDLDQVTQSNISITQDSSRTTKQLEEQAKRLNNLVQNLSDLLGQKKSSE
jgi:methyl-accepting chemotaxis protein